MAATTPATAMGVLEDDRIERWRADWDAVMAMYMPGIAGFETALFAAAEAAHEGFPDHVLDLGGGPGLLAERMAHRWPTAAVTLLDLDPVMLALARAGSPAGVGVVSADLAQASWPAQMCSLAPFDLVTAVMTMHCLGAGQAHALYRETRKLMAPGGLMIVADVMPDHEIPAVMSRLPSVPDPYAAGLAWSQWWNEVSQVPEFEPLLRERESLFGTAEEFARDLDWHARAARDAGFTQAGAVWRCGSHAALAAIA
jgi:SAM-dependent methyltransferase